MPGRLLSIESSYGVLRKTQKGAASSFGNRRDSLARSLLAALQPTADAATWFALADSS